jgi:4-amino-4-deoxy-L-arabinose transferase-like glycosyltransferase
MAWWRNRGLGTWLLALSAIAAVYALGIGWSGGFDVQYGPLRLRSRDAARPAFLAGLAFILFLVIDHRRARLALASAWDRLETPAASRVLLAIALAWTMTAGVLFNTMAAGGSDSYGYVSQVPLLRQGMLVDLVAFDPAFTWQDASRTLVPLGYVPTEAADVIAPLYPPGLSLLMVPASLFGDRAVYLIVPVFGALLIACTWSAGIRLGDPLAAGLTALFLSASPTFLYQLVQPMSDVPAAACWLAALLAVRRGRTGDAVAGLFVGLAVLIRPNLAPLALVVFVVGWRLSPWTIRGAAMFAVPAAAAVLLLLHVQQVRFGSPTASGYGRFQDLFQLASVATNLRQYPNWLTAAHTPFIWLSALSPMVLRRTPALTFALALLGLAAGVWLLYLPYTAFQPHEWHYTRFLLPAIAVMMLLATLVALRPVRRLAPEARTVIAAALSVALLFMMGRYALDNGAFHLHEAEQKYPAAGDAVVTRVGHGGWVLAAQHSGSLRLYAGSRTVRWDLVQPRDIDRVLELLGARGRPPLLVLDPGEVDLFRDRFSGSRAVTAMALVAVVQETQIYQFE